MSNKKVSSQTFFHNDLGDDSPDKNNMYRNEVSERNFSFLWKIKFIKNPRNYEK
jgi:hypothetical protein